MNKRKWTQSQQDAISARQGTILVSAAAGSGKTAVLVQRVIERLIDEENPCDANKLLIVTFTNAAALEMRERISAKIDELIHENPSNIRLKRQKILLSSAKISTVHSFCGDIVRENFYKLGISQNFRISDSSEMELIRNEAAQQVLEELYKKNDKEFNNLIDAFCSNKDDKKIINIINQLYDFIRSHPFPDIWLDEKLSMYRINCPITDTKWGKVIMDFAKDAITYCVDVTKESILMLNDDPKIYDSYYDALSSDLVGLNLINDAIDNNDFDDTSSKIRSFAFAKLKSLRGYNDDELKLRICDNREEVKSTIKRLLKLFSSQERECLQDIENLYPIVYELFMAVKMFGDKLDEIKLKKNIADFSDLEHFMLKLLVRPSDDGFIKTDDAVKLSEKFEEIMVDEYQDTNEAQDIIFRAISRNEENMFMVGDVKQSIYKFRQAMPEIFLNKKEKYKEYNQNKPVYPAKIILDRNFRSRQGVIDSVNFLFRQIMSKTVGDMNYDKQEELVFAADYIKKQEPDTSLDIIDISNNESEDMDIIEARHISNIILNMVKNKYQIKDKDTTRAVKYSDFCVLIRNANKHANIYATEMKRNLIPVSTDTASDFFKTAEIAIILSLLRIIDNPIQDIPLVSVLMSPIYGFTPDKLAKIRLVNKKVPLYLALKEAALNGDNDCADFIKQIEEYRNLSTLLTSYDLINKIYEATGYLSIVGAMKEPEARISNLRVLLKYARENEKRGHKGLSSFIWFIDKLERQGSDIISGCSVSDGINAVNIMSIHRSKGLEFPICILAGTSRKFNKRIDEILLHPVMGLGIKIRDTHRMIEYSTMPREAVLIESQREDMSEELRVLYVAMTRAREKLIIISSLKDTAKTIGKLASGLTDDEKISPYMVRKAASISDLIILSFIRHPDADKLREYVNTNNIKILKTDSKLDVKIIYPDVNSSNVEYKSENINNIDNELLNIINDRLNYVYPKINLSNVISKVSVSDIVDNKFKGSEILKTPRFMQNFALTPAEKGSAVHKFIEYSDYALARKDLESEVDRLLSSGILTNMEAKSIDRRKLDLFYKSSLMDRILKSDKILREYRFTVDIDAGTVNKDIDDNLKNEMIVLQGAVDCIIIENDEAVIIDYKTDKIIKKEILLDMYSQQIKLYKYAVEKSLNIRVRECILYSIYNNEEIVVL